MFAEFLTFKGISEAKALGEAFMGAARRLGDRLAAHVIPRPGNAEEIATKTLDVLKERNDLFRERIRQEARLFEDKLVAERANLERKLAADRANLDIQAALYRWPLS